MICLDTDVLAIHHLFTWDKRYPINEKALKILVKKEKLCTTIHNLLELCGLYAMAGLANKVNKVLERYLRSKEILILFPGEVLDWSQYVVSILSYIRRGIPYGDAQIAQVIEQHDVEILLTWNTKHFKGKISAEVLTPLEYLEKYEEKQSAKTNTSL